MRRSRRNKNKATQQQVKHPSAVFETVIPDNLESSEQNMASFAITNVENKLFRYIDEDKTGMSGKLFDSMIDLEYLKKYYKVSRVELYPDLEYHILEGFRKVLVEESPSNIKALVERLCNCYMGYDVYRNAFPLSMSKRCGYTEKDVAVSALYSALTTAGEDESNNTQSTMKVSADSDTSAVASSNADEDKTATKDTNDTVKEDETTHKDEGQQSGKNHKNKSTKTKTTKETKSDDTDKKKADIVKNIVPVIIDRIRETHPEIIDDDIQKDMGCLADSLMHLSFETLKETDKIIKISPEFIDIILKAVLSDIDHSSENPRSDKKEIVKENHYSKYRKQAQNDSRVGVRKLTLDDVKPSLGLAEEEDINRNIDDTNNYEAKDTPTVHLYGVGDIPVGNVLIDVNLVDLRVPTGYAREVDKVDARIRQINDDETRERAFRAALQAISRLDNTSPHGEVERAVNSVF